MLSHTQRIRIVISCGPTREPLDPVRFISNYSTGTLGVTMARECARMGHDVTLVHGPIPVPKDVRVRKISFETVLDLMRALRSAVRRCDVLFMNAAVSDFKPLEAARIKIKKGARFLDLSLVENPDVLKYLGRYKRGKIYVGFSLESKDIYRHSLEKLRRKGLDLIVAQKVTPTVKPFGPVPIDVMLIDRHGRRENFSKISKVRLARVLMKRVEAIRRGKVAVI